MTYSKQLDKLRSKVLAELIRQVPTKHDYLKLISEDDEDDRENVPMVHLRYKHNVYSSEYVIRIENDGDNTLLVCEDADTSKVTKRNVETFSTPELCQVIDCIIDIVKNR